MRVARRLLAPLLPLLLAGCSPTAIANALTPRGGIAPQEGLAYGGLPRQRLDLYLPPGHPDAPLVVFFHGGGWRSGDRGDYAFLARVLAQRGLAVAVPDYRLWPDSRWPDFLEDAALAVAWLRARPELAGRQVFLMGHSAGGFLAAALALDPTWLGEASRVSLAGGVLLAAPIAWQPLDEPSRSIFAPAPGGRIEAAPDPAGLAAAPPMLLLHGEADDVVYPLHATNLAAALRRAGRPVRLRTYPGMGHVGVLAAMAAPVRALGLAGAPVLAEVTDFLADPVREA